MRDLTFSTLCADAKADATCCLLDGGLLRIYDGAKPETADTPVAGQTLLASLRFGPAAFAPSGGARRAYAFAPCLGDVQGTPTWFRALTADGAVVFDGTVGPVPPRESERPLDGSDVCDMYVDGDVFEGGEVVVESLVYMEAKR